jgi:hypothetical protein
MSASLRLYILALLLIAAASGFTYWQMPSYHRQFAMQHTGRDTVAEVIHITTGRTHGRKQRVYHSATLRFDAIDFDGGKTLPTQYSRYYNYPHIAVAESVRVGDQIPIMYDPSHPQTIVRGHTTDDFWTLLRANDLVADFVMRVGVCLLGIFFAGTLCGYVLGPLVTSPELRPKSAKLREQPKTPNHAMERTSTRRASTFSVTTALPLRSEHALSGRRSSCSR